MSEADGFILSATDAACYEFPGEDERGLRDAFVKGAEWAATGAPLTPQPAHAPWGPDHESIARIIDPEAWEEYLLEDGRVDQQVASIFRDAYELSLAKADLIRALPPGEASGWRPIETAPRDGTEFIACVEGYAPFSCRWSEGAWLHLDDYEGRVGYEPTHWQPMPERMPLPSPPGEEGGRDTTDERPELPCADPIKGQRPAQHSDGGGQ